MCSPTREAAGVSRAVPRPELPQAGPDLLAADDRLLAGICVRRWASGRDGRCWCSCCRSLILLVDGFFLWEWSPSWLDPRIDRALMLIDPAGFRWLNETWLKVDRGVAFYNTAPIPPDAAFLASRAGDGRRWGWAPWRLASRHFAATLRGSTTPRPGRGTRRERSAPGGPLPLRGRPGPRSPARLRWPRWG